MSSKSTRSSKTKEEIIEIKTKATKAPAVFKVFYIAEAFLNDTTTELHLERFYHPGRNAQALFITRGNEDIMEVMEFNEPRRSWLINNDLCSNGRIYVTTPIDATFLALHHIRKHCTNKALELETIQDDKDASVSRLLTKFVSATSLSCIADVKAVGEMRFYKYNHNKALAWLSLKTKRLAVSLKDANIYCGRGSFSQNFTSCEKTSDEIVQDLDYLRFACEIVGGYLALDLHEDLMQYLNIPNEVKATEEKDESKKRKSLTTLKGTKNKKMKTENQDDHRDEDENDDCVAEKESAASKLANSSLLDDSVHDEDKEDKKIAVSPVPVRQAPLKERVLTTKEKALAKSAKGTKSIASFFKK